VDGLRDPVEVLVELPGEARLADARDSRDRHEVCLLVVGGCVEEILDLPQLAVAPDEGRFEALRLERTTQPRDDTLGSPERRQSLLPFELERSGFFVDDRLLR